MTDVERNIYSCFFLSNGICLNLDVSWLEALGNNSIFAICNFVDSFELKIKVLIVIMSLLLSDETREVLLFSYNW